MTHFERTFLQMKHHNKILGSLKAPEVKDGVIDLTSELQAYHNDIQMQLEYRELDRIANELEKELNALKALRMEMENYKIKFSVEVKDEATKEIQRVLNGIDKMVK